jgi:hypothetical protein
MHQLLGQAQKPEGNSAVTFENAINRLAEMRCIAIVHRGRGGKDQALVPGDASAGLAALERRLAASLSTDGPGRAALGGFEHGAGDVVAASSA